LLINRASPAAWRSATACALVSAAKIERHIDCHCLRTGGAMAGSNSLRCGPPSEAQATAARLEYFTEIYGAADPYGSRDRWYEQRKRRILLSALPRRRFRTAFEPACGTGALTRELSARCAHVLASDFCEQALVQAREALGHVANVSLENQALPADWPGQEHVFDLIVVSEVCSFLQPHDVQAVARLCAGSLATDGVVAVCDWRWPFEARVCAEHCAHDIFNAVGLHRLVRHEEDDFLLGVWSVAPLSVAQREGIVGQS
jgi:SAM-dependent methyltransferase